MLSLIFTARDRVAVASATREIAETAIRAEALLDAVFSSSPPMLSLFGAELRHRERIASRAPSHVEDSYGGVPCSA